MSTAATKDRQQVTIKDHAAVAHSESAAIINMIERAAMDPTVDVEKLRQLMDLRSQAEAKIAERAFDAAMTKAQQAMVRVRADSNNSQTRSRYASYSALDRALRPIYTEHGFGPSFDTEPSNVENMVRVVCRVSHDGGHSRKYQIDMPADGKGAKGGDVMTKTHATGSAVSYGRRYLLMMIFNIAVGDDDGNAASVDASNRITEQQVGELVDLLEARSVPRDKFLNWVRKGSPTVQTVEDIPAAFYDSCVTAIKQFGK